MVLAYHTPREWARFTYARLVRLGCSGEYARREWRRILAEARKEEPRLPEARR